MDNTGKGCGLYLGRDLCDDGGGGGCDCGPFTGETCTYSHYADKHGFTFTPDLTVGRPAEEQIVRSLLSEARAARLPPYAQRIWQLYQDAESLHIRAKVRMWAAPALTGEPREKWANGSYEYWEAGPRYRHRLHAPAELGLAQISEVAYDGSVFQLLLGDSNILSLSSKDARTLPKGLRNPAFLPLDFLVADQDLGCPACDLRMADFASVPLARDLPTRDPLFERGQTRFSPQPKFSIEDGSRRRVIEKRVDGQRISRIVLSDFRTVGDVPFPFLIELTHFEGGKPTLRSTYIIEVMEIGAPIDESVFNLSWDGLDNIYDDDRGTFVHRIGCPRSSNQCQAPRGEN